MALSTPRRAPSPPRRRARPTWRDARIGCNQEVIMADDNDHDRLFGRGVNANLNHGREEAMTDAKNYIRARSNITSSAPRLAGERAQSLADDINRKRQRRSEEHTSELQS